MKRLSIAIDGPAGAGKSSVAKVLAKKLVEEGPERRGGFSVKYST